MTELSPEVIAVQAELLARGVVVLEEDRPRDLGGRPVIDRFTGGILVDESLLDTRPGRGS